MSASARCGECIFRNPTEKVFTRGIGSETIAFGRMSLRETIRATETLVSVQRRLHVSLLPQAIPPSNKIPKYRQIQLKSLLKFISDR